ncbi:hypothetical protein DPMN_183083 [Dreissena polymorpha]|uniref:Uncharacterized protein n=1 Tax=Dreissena polymorpha TaxID=45954 RepID=A0A9D4DGY3_DREPO|nr:hypothetical protein DPMN_183083 [Dreissena polymorpha]
MPKSNQMMLIKTLLTKMGNKKWRKNAIQMIRQNMMKKMMLRKPVKLLRLTMS